MSGIIFQAKTQEGSIIKSLVELLQNNIKDACFEIDYSGIRLRMMDYHKIILLDMMLAAENFSTYRFEKRDKMYLGLSVGILHKTLKNLKKNDTIEFVIEAKNPHQIIIKITPKDTTRVTASTMNVQNIQNVEIELPEIKCRPVIISSGEFQKMCKTLQGLSPNTQISTKGNIVRFTSDDGVIKRDTYFGQTDDNTEYTFETKDADYTENFSSEQLSRITKFASLSKNMQVCCQVGQPLLLRSSVGSLGKIGIYLKSTEFQEAEARSVEPESE